MIFGDTTQKGNVKFGIRFANRIKILGVVFSNECASIDIKENFDSKISKLERICKLWEKRNLTLLGKITILKTFGVSQFIYLMQSIGISEENLVKINKILFGFIWQSTNKGNKKVIERVKRDTLCSSLDEGGLNMIDLIKMQHSFLLKWADKLLSNNEDALDRTYHWKLIPIRLFEPVGGISVFNCSVHGSNFKGLDLIKSNYWKRVLNVWLKYKYVGEDSSSFDINNPIFNNSSVRFKNNTIFIESCIKKSMILIKDFIENGRIITFESFREKFGMNAETHLAYNIIFNALNRIVGKLKMNNPPQQYWFMNSEAGKINRKGYYNMINKKKVASIITEFRIKFSQEECDPFIWTVASSCTSEVKLIQLQWKILHNIYPTGTLLHKMKIRSTENCESCGERDSLSHFFVFCSIAKKIWKEAEMFIYNLTGIKICLDEKRVILGILKDDRISFSTQKALNLINRVILIGKHTISKYKVNNIGNPIIFFEKELWVRNLSSLI